MIRKTSETRPLTGTIVNEYNNSQVNAYSCEYVNDCNTYSTNEVFTGKYWKDGKPIYRKIITTNSTSTFSHNISNVDTIFFDLSASFNKKSTGNIAPLSYYANNSDYGAWFINSTQITAPGQNFVNISETVFSICYTKTTD